MSVFFEGSISSAAESFREGVFWLSVEILLGVFTEESFREDSSEEDACGTDAFKALESILEEGL